MVVVGYPTDSDGNCKVVFKLFPGQTKNVNLKKIFGKQTSVTSSVSTQINPTDPLLQNKSDGSVHTLSD